MLAFSLVTLICLGVVPPLPDAISDAKRSFDAAIAKKDETAAFMAIREYLAIGTAEAADALVEHGLLSDDPWVEEVTREGMSRAEGAFLDQLCLLAKEHPDRRVRLQLHPVLARRDSIEAYRSLLSGLFDPKHEVAISAVDALAKKNDIRCVPYLIDALDQYEKDGWDNSVIAWKIRHLLGYMTGEDYIEARKWRRFWKQHGGKLKKPQKGKKIEELEDKGLTGVGPRREYPRFFGIEILSQRIVFIFDTSMSMRELDPGPGDPPEMTRIERMRREARRLIGAIPPDTQFTVVAFSSGVHRMSGSLLPANDRNKARAFKFIDKFEPSGETWTDKALESAFKVANARTIFLLSDGSPVRNTKAIDIRDILSWLSSNNRFRKIRIHTVGFADTKHSIGTFLRDVARENDGIYRELP